MPLSDSECDNVADTAEREAAAGGRHRRVHHRDSLQIHGGAPLELSVLRRKTRMKRLMGSPPNNRLPLVDLQCSAPRQMQLCLGLTEKHPVHLHTICHASQILPQRVLSIPFKGS